MQEKINKFIEKHESIKSVCNGCEVFGHMLHIFVPAGLSAYLLHVYSDLIVIVVAAMLGLYAFWQLLKLVHAAVVNKPKKSAKK